MAKSRKSLHSERILMSIAGEITTSVSLSDHLSVRPSVCPSICLSVCWLYLPLHRLCDLPYRRLLHDNRTLKDTMMVSVLTFQWPSFLKGKHAVGEGGRGWEGGPTQLTPSLWMYTCTCTSCPPPPFLPPPLPLPLSKLLKDPSSVVEDSLQQLFLRPGSPMDDSEPEEDAEGTEEG